MYVYIDVYFAYNFLMDFAMLIITRKFIKVRKNIIRLTIAAIIGAFYATFVLVSSWTGIGESGAKYILIPLLMVLVTFGKKQIPKNIAVLYATTFISSGIINCIYYSADYNRGIIEKAMASTFGNVNIIFALCLVTILVTIVIAVENKVRADWNESKNLFDVSIIINATTVNVKALSDTGNSLVEPVTKKPVSIIEEEILKPDLLEDLKYFFVPYNSVGKSHGLMRVFVADELTVNGKQISNAIVGIHEGKLSQKGKYQMLLQPTLLDCEER